MGKLVRKYLYLIVKGNTHGRGRFIRDVTLLEHHRPLVLQGPCCTNEVVNLPTPEEELLKEPAYQQFAVNTVRAV